jgi:hypothetical protein
MPFCYLGNVTLPSWKVAFGVYKVGITKKLDGHAYQKERNNIQFHLRFEFD